MTMLNNVRVAILSCGWLGFALAADLKKKGALINAGYRNPDMLDELKKAGFNPFILHCDPDCQGPKLSSFFHSDILIITLPFKRQFKDAFYYLKQINGILRQVKSSPIKHLIFTSSTGIYDGLSGHVDTQASLCLDKKRVAALAACEKAIIEFSACHASILRLAGLYGPHRELGRFLAGKVVKRPAKQPVNIAHQQLCIDRIIHCINKKIMVNPASTKLNHIENVVENRHPSREELYTHEALKLGLSCPIFEDKSPLNEKNYRIVLDG